MTRERSSASGARTGQWSGTVRQSGPIVRRRKEARDETAVLEALGASCEPWRGALNAEVREWFLEEEWHQLRRWLEEEPGARQRRAVVMTALVVDARSLRIACTDRQSAPVWLDSAGKLLIEAPDERLSTWATTTVRRGLEVEVLAHKEYQEAVANGATSEVQALAVLYHLVDATIDDVAKLCGVTRETVLALVWGDA